MEDSLLPPLEVLAQALLSGGLVPAVASTALLGMVLRGGSRASADLTGCLAGAVALAGGFWAGYVLLGWAPLVPGDCWHWLPYLAVMSVAAGLIDRSVGAPAAVHWGTRCGAAALAAWLLVPDYPSLQSVRPFWLGGSAAAVVLLWSVLEGVTKRQTGPLPPLLLTAVALAVSVVLLLAASAKFAQLAGILAATLGGHTLVSWWFPDRPLTRGAVPGVVVLLFGLLVAGRLCLDSEVPAASFLFVAAAPLGLAAGSWSASERRRRCWQVAAVLLPAGLGVALAALA